MNITNLARSLLGVRELLKLTEKVNSLSSRLEQTVDLMCSLNRYEKQLEEHQQKIKHLEDLLEEEDRIIRAIAASITKEQIHEIADRFGDRNLRKLVDTLVAEYGRQLTMKIREPLEDAVRGQVDGWMRDWMRIERNSLDKAEKSFSLTGVLNEEDK
jgi:hypothetical protein